MVRLLEHKWIAFLKLVRIENLVIIALTQILLRYFVLEKVLGNHHLQLTLDDLLFYLMVASTVLIAAAGYIINDYFDVKTDMINHPDTVVVGRVIKRRWAIILHVSLTTLGVLLGIYVALKTGYLRLAIFHIAAATLLWFYSTHFKKQLLTGNLVVALLTASVTFMPFIFEMGIMQRMQPYFNEIHLRTILSCMKTTLFFALFAFLTTLAREIIKDLEDYKGDEATGGRTMPIVWGVHAARIFSAFIILITIILLCVAIYNQWRFYHHALIFSNLYIFFALIIPLLFLELILIRAGESRHYRRASILLKFIMLFGISYSFVFYYS
jgi:4-hydroxybenzoate polyprenyltransferase